MDRFTKIITLLGLNFITVLSLTQAAGCDTAAPATQTTTGLSSAIEITDDAGVTYNFEEPVDTVISLAPSITEIVYFIGAGGSLVGRTDYCNFPEEALQVESIGGYYDPNLEKIVLLDPDVVLADSIQVTTGDAAYLQSKGLTVIILAAADIDGIMKDIELVGEITGNKDIAVEKVAGLKARIDAVTNALAGLPEKGKPTVLHITWYDPLWTAGKGTFLDILIEMAGGINIFSDVELDAEVDLEQAVIRDPGVITVVTDHGTEVSYSNVIAGNSPFAKTGAYINARIYVVDSDIVCRAGPRIVDALELYAGLLHPELFS